ncbi:hypothetical protein Tco_1043565 [Tanacetum coccineum]|uniref:Reverse transcriptase domain-containing protein n=1 Tax=Tanacetum coccineum TaxID=301880 RepID=A0ABQ5GN10_9ASTR
MAPMASSDPEVKTCSKIYLKNYETLKKQYDDLVAKKHETEFKAITYKRGLDTVEAQLVTYRKNEVLFSEEVAVLKREVGIKQYEINTLKTEFEKVKQEKDAIDLKIEKFGKASKDLDQLLESQITDKSKKGLGYSAVPPPHPLIYNRPNKLDLSYSGLEEFQQPEFEVYGLRANKKWVSDNEDEVESPVVVEKKTVVPTIPKVNVVRPKQQEKPVKKTVRYAEMYRSKSPKGNQRNWNNLKSQQLGSDFVMNNKACFSRTESQRRVSVNSQQRLSARADKCTHFSSLLHTWFYRASVAYSTYPRLLIQATAITPSDIQHSAATKIWGCYRLVSEPRVFWGADEEVSDGCSPRVIVLGYDGLLMQPVAPPSPDYIPGPEDPQTPPVPQDEDEREAMFIQPHDHDYVPEPIYPEYIPLDDKHEFLAEEQPLPPVDSPTAESPGYITKSDPEGYKDDETENGPVDYPIDGGDDGDDDDGDSSRDDADDEDEDEEDEEEEEEEHPALADSAVIVPTVEPASISLPPEAEVERLLAMPTPSPSPPISLSPPSTGERLARCTAPPAHSSSPLVPSPLLPSSGCPTQIQTLRIASTQALIDVVTAALPSPPLPPLPPSLYIPPPIDRRDDVPESVLPPRKRLCLSTLDSRYEIGKSSTARPTEGRGIDYGFVSTVDAEARQQGISEVGYGIRDTWVDPTEAIPEVAPMTVEEVNIRVTELAELHERDTQELYALLEDAQDGDSMDCRGGGLCFLIGLGSLDRIESGDPSGASVKFATYTLLGAALTCWNGQIRTLVPDAYSMTWEVKGNDVPAYTERFQELTLICSKFISNETEKVDKYISGLPDNIYGNVKSARPKTLDETIELANDLMDQKLRTYAERQSDNKRKVDDSSRNNHGHQQ